MVMTEIEIMNFAAKIELENMLPYIRSKIGIKKKRVVRFLLTT